MPSVRRVLDFFWRESESLSLYENRDLQAKLCDWVGYSINTSIEEKSSFLEQEHDSSPNPINLIWNSLNLGPFLNSKP